MANHESEELDRALQALDNAARRSMLRKLNKGPAMVGELNELFEMSAPAVSRHLRILEAAGLIERTRQGTFHGIALNPTPLAAVTAFVGSLRSPATQRTASGRSRTPASPVARKTRPKPEPAAELPVWDPEDDEIAKLL